MAIRILCVSVDRVCSLKTLKNSWIRRLGGSCLTSTYAGTAPNIVSGMANRSHFIDVLTASTKSRVSYTVRCRN